MAAIDRSTAASAELEFMRREDSSWHPCHVTLSATEVGLVVNYENADREDTVLNEEELRRLRMRSVPLKDEDCVHVQEGDHILATGKLETNCLYFDAVVEKALRVRHSKRSPCRCTFRIKWIHQDFKERTLIVTASSIMKLATRSINEHPIICSFLSMLKNSRCATSPVPDTEDGIDHEMDLNELLEKQIEVINNSVDVSKEKYPKDFQLGIQFNKKGEIQCRAVAKPEVTKPSNLVPSDSATPQRITRSARKQKMETMNTNPPPADSFTEKLPETPQLNPLAARAAFASLMSKVSYEGNFSVELNFAQSLYGTKSLNSPDICPETTTSISYEPQSSNTSSEISTLKRANGNKSSEVPDDTMQTVTRTSAKRKLSPSLPPRATRITRAAIAKDIIHREIHVDNNKLESPNSASRVTRSAVRKVNTDQPMDVIQGMEECISDKLINSDSTYQNDTEESDVVVEVFCQENKNLGAKKGKELKAPNASPGLWNTTSTKRLTRSKVLEEKPSQTLEATCVLEEHKFPETRSPSSVEGKVGASNGKVTGSAQSKKIKEDGSSLKKNEVRKSPRLRVLP